MPIEIILPPLVPCPKCGNEHPNYAIGIDRAGYFYVRDRKCNKYVFTTNGVSKKDAAKVHAELRVYLTGI